MKPSLQQKKSKTKNSRPNRLRFQTWRRKLRRCLHNSPRCWNKLWRRCSRESTWLSGTMTMIQAWSRKWKKWTTWTEQKELRNYRCICCSFKNERSLISIIWFYIKWRILTKILNLTDKIWIRCNTLKREPTKINNSQIFTCKRLKAPRSQCPLQISIKDLKAKLSWTNKTFNQMFPSEPPSPFKIVLELLKSWWGKVLMIWSHTLPNKSAMKPIKRSYRNLQILINLNLTLCQNPITFKSAKLKESLTPCPKNIWRQKQTMKSKIKK